MPIECLGHSLTRQVTVARMFFNIARVDTEAGAMRKATKSIVHENTCANEMNDSVAERSAGKPLINGSL